MKEKFKKFPKLFTNEIHPPVHTILGKLDTGTIEIESNRGRK